MKKNTKTWTYNNNLEKILATLNIKEYTYMQQRQTHTEKFAKNKANKDKMMNMRKKT